MNGIEERRRRYRLANMRNRLNFGISSLVILVGILFTSGTASASSFAYNNFSAPSELIFQGDAAVVENRVRLAPAELSKAGGLWFHTKQNVKDGFEATFQFQLTNKKNYGANGIAFVIQNNETPQLGIAGHGMGYRGIPNALVVKFDPYHYRKKNYVKYDQVAVLVNCSTNIYPPNNGAIASTTNVFYTDERVHTVKIKYQSRALEVFLDDLAFPILTAKVNLAESVTLDDGRAWIGLTAATGGDYFNHDLLAWSFTSPDKTGSLADLSVTKIRIISPTSNPNDAVNPSATNSTYVTSPTPTLPHDPAFGHALPEGIGLSHGIEASVDLVHWQVVTNAVLYFRDPDSTNYDHRFYRFRQRE